ncbi:P1 family peptidase [Arthrobacter cupressi]|uniref:L-aminopeptidase/D-esterase n=1 Tax=Arthrobacter cupressi TaxID=1045773 RepID=A0A1G8MUP5_9MICC|nr:P1 family peptidase [Arthrobacter cupressi]NYD76941.1 L-aminopeptidase/D-esterase-like protein [Arthrobacter cupressi]SDI71586.1 L-aminopeptidase/D-esterase [Arthrobacter cupressi]
MASKITDVPGIRVGQVQKTGDGWLSGVTVVLPPPGTVGSVDVRGGGPGTHETDALDPTTLVPTVDAVVLTGGSAYGLAAAHGAQRWCEEQGRGFPVAGGVVPIVPAAAIFDLGRGGDFAARPGPDMGYDAAAAAAASGEQADVVRGNAGAGTGAVLGRGAFKGGVGTASLTLDGLSPDGPVVVGAIAVVNALGLPVGADAPEVPGKPELNTTLAVVATNAALDPAECKRTAAAAHAGLARALDPSHTLADGDTVFALATGAVALDRSTEQARQISLITLQSAAAEAVRLAILDGIAAAETITTPAGEFRAFPAGERGREG